MGKYTVNLYNGTLYIKNYTTSPSVSNLRFHDVDEYGISDELLDQIDFSNYSMK